MCVFSIPTPLSQLPHIDVDVTIGDVNKRGSNSLAHARVHFSFANQYLTTLTVYSVKIRLFINNAISDYIRITGLYEKGDVC